MTGTNGAAAGLTSDQVDELLLSARYGDLADLQQVLTPTLLTADVVASVKSETDNTMLHYASANGHTDVVQFLLPAVTLQLLLAQNDAGNTPLHWAALNGHLDTVRLLVSTIETLETKHPDEAKRLNLFYHPFGASGATSQDSDPTTTAESEQTNDGSERKLWDVRNKAGRGPMSEAQMCEQENVVKYLLERMIDGPEPPASQSTLPTPDLATQTADLKIDN